MRLLMMARRRHSRFAAAISSCGAAASRAAAISSRIEAAGFGHTAADTLQGIARYVDTCRTHGVPAVTIDGPTSDGADGTGAGPGSDAIGWELG